MSCNAITVQWDITTDTDATLRFELRDRATGAAVDLTGATFATKGRTSRGSSTVVWTATATLDADPTTGRFTLTIPLATTSTLESGQGVWDVLMALGGTVTPVITDGRYTIERAVSR